MFDFMKYRYLYLGLSLLIIVPGLISLVFFGFKPAIDFTGGSLLEVSLSQSEKSAEFTTDNVREVTKDIYDMTSVQQSGPNQFIIKGKDIPNELKNKVKEELSAVYGPVTEQRFETVGPTLGKELIYKTVFAAALAAVVITIYVGRQFRELKFGVCAILAMLHDSLILLGTFSLLGKFLDVEVDVLFVTALLTTLSFSVHDTIVVYDRIREFKRLHPRASLHDVINASVLQTLGRSLNNSLTIIVMLLCLVVLGGMTIRWFSVALLVGAITGTYSSTFTAAPLLLVWEDLQQRLVAKRTRNAK